MYWRLLGTAYRFSPSTFGRLRRYDSLTTSFQNHLSSLSTDTLGLRKKCWTRQLFVRSDHFSLTPPLYIVSTSPASLCRLNLFLSPRNLVRLGGTGRCLFWPIFGQPLDVDMDLTRILCRTVHSPCPTKPRTANVSFKLQVWIYAFVYRVLDSSLTLSNKTKCLDLITVYRVDSSPSLFNWLYSFLPGVI